MSFLSSLFKGKTNESQEQSVKVIDANKRTMEDALKKIDGIRKNIASKVYETTNHVADGVNTIASDIDKLVESQSKNFDDIQGIKKHIHDTDKVIKESKSMVNSLEESTKNLISLKPQLDNQSSNLKKLESTILNISEIGTHVKLLSFNASLEASRAGDSGRSFMVVADEIQKLSLLTSQHLGDMDKALKTYSEKNQEMSSSITSYVDEETGTVVNFSTMMAGLVENIGKIMESLDSLSKSVESQLSSMSEIKNQTAHKVEILNYEMSQLIDETLGTTIVDLLPRDVMRNTQKYTIIDVRREDEFYGELGHINDSKLITIGSKFGSKICHFDRDTTYLFVCRSGGRSARAARIAQISGFKNVFNMAGGMLAWNKENLPVKLEKSA